MCKKMSEVLEFLGKNPLLYLTMQKEDELTKDKPILYYFQDEDKPYFCTSNIKPIYHKLAENPKFKITFTTEEFRCIKITGEVEFIDDVEVKEKLVGSNDLLKSLYESKDNLVFEIFTITGNVDVVDF